MKIRSALILAAGEGTRMHPLTLTRPKPLLPVGGKPMIEWTISALKNAGVERVYVLVSGKNEAAIQTALGDSVSYVRQEVPLGTANAIGCAEGTIKEPFICMNGDLVVEDELFKKLIEYYEKRNASIITVTQSRKPESFGVVEVGKDNKVLGIIEKPEKPKSNFINAGIYVFGTEIFELIKKTKKSQRGEYEITDTLRMGEVYGYVYEGFWLDVGKPWDMLDANEFYVKNQKKKIEGTVQQNAMLEGDVAIGRGTIVRAGSYIIGPVAIGKDCLIGPNCFIRPFTAIGNNCHIGNAVEIKNSILMDNTNIPHLSYVGDSIIGEKCNFGAGTNVANLRFDDAEVKLNIRGERMSSGRRKFGCVVGDGVKTGINVSIMPGKKIGPNKLIPPNFIVDKDLE